MMIHFDKIVRIVLKHIKNYISSFHILWVMIICLIHPGTGFALDQTNLETAIKKTEALIEEKVRTKQIPGCAIAVVYQNRVVFLRGYGVRKLGNQEPIDSDTVFQLGSVSKPISASLAAILESKGYLNIDDAVSLYLPKFSLNTKQPQNALHIRNILNHTSGVPRGGFNNMIESFASHEELVDALQNKQVTARVGVHYDYNNAMFALIADITQAATHQKFENALNSFLFTPLNMTQTSASLEGISNNVNRASPHTRNSKGALCACEDYSKGYYSVVPAGGINSTARDMANFLRAQLGGFPQVLSAQALKRMQMPSIPTKGMLGGAGHRIKHPHYGLGWRTVEFSGEPLIFHGGWLRGFTNFIGFLPEQQLGIVILHNGDSKFSSKTAVKFFEIAKGLSETPEGKVKASKPKNKGKAKATSKAKPAVKKSKSKSTKKNRSK